MLTLTGVDLAVQRDESADGLHLRLYVLVLCLAVIHRCRHDLVLVRPVIFTACS